MAKKRKIQSKHVQSKLNYHLKKFSKHLLKYRKDKANKGSGEKKNGHGRNHSDKYAGATTEEVKHNELQASDKCEALLNIKAIKGKQNFKKCAYGVGLTSRSFLKKYIFAFLSNPSLINSTLYP